MAWTGQSFVLNQILTSTQMNNVQGDITAQANGDSGAPKQQTAGIADGAVNEDKIASGAVHQAELETLTDEVTTSTNSTDDSIGDSVCKATLPGGSYGFYPRVKASSQFSEPLIQIHASTTITSQSYSSRIHMFNNLATEYTLYAEQTYVVSSPPFDLGDGEVPLFIFLNYSKAQGRVKTTYVSHVPPWAYNGPTSIMAERKSGGRSYKKIKEYDEETGELSTREIEIDAAYKNSDMGIIPHPFVDDDDKDVMLLDPVDTLYLLELHKNGESISELIYSDYIRLDNESISRQTPRGVRPTRFRWKNTQRRFGEVIADRRERTNNST